MVKVTLNGKGEMRGLKIDPKLADPAEIEVLEDLIVAAAKDAQIQGRRAYGDGDGQAHRRPAPAAGHEAAVLRRWLGAIVRCRARRMPLATDHPWPPAISSG